MISRRSFLAGAATAGSVAAAALARARTVVAQGVDGGARGEQLYPVAPTSNYQNVVLNTYPEPGRDHLGWTSPHFLYEEVKGATKHHGADLGALDKPITKFGQHYTFSHFDQAVIDPAAYSLSVSGNVSDSMNLSLADLQARQHVTETVLLECAGNGRAALNPRTPRIATPWFNQAFGVFEYVGTPLAALLAEAGVGPGSVEVVFTGSDEGVEGLVHQHFAKSLPLSKALDPHVLIVWQANGMPLPQGHGGPARLLVPGWYGTYSVKWLASIEVVTREFHGFQMWQSYRYTGDVDPIQQPGAGVPVREINVRAAIKPPGIADPNTGMRWLEAGPTHLVGKAWSGFGTITRVEVSTNDGNTWSDASLGPPVSAQSWTPWTFDWNAEHGNHVLAARATDANGNVQPRHPEWNFLGVGINGYERMRVFVT
jgi:DMSO/TMAO reductase YedYZ molybdopterin-dependent catalytic subunit